MSVIQTVDIPANRRLIIDVPGEIPPGPAVLTVTPAASRKPAARHFGRLKNSKAFAGDPMEIQRQMRVEWDD